MRTPTLGAGWREGASSEQCPASTSICRPGRASSPLGTSVGPVSPLRLHSDPWVSDGVTLLHYTNFVFSAGNPVVDAETCCLCCSSSLDFSLGVGEICMSGSPSGVVPRSQSLSLSGVAGSLSCVPVPVSPPPCPMSLSLCSVPSSLSRVPVPVFPPPCAVSLSLSSVAGSLSCVPVFQAPCPVSLSLSSVPGSLSLASISLFCFVLLCVSIYARGHPVTLWGLGVAFSVASVSLGISVPRPLGSGGLIHLLFGLSLSVSGLSLGRSPPGCDCGPPCPLPLRLPL